MAGQAAVFAGLPRPTKAQIRAAEQSARTFLATRQRTQRRMNAAVKAFGDYIHANIEYEKAVERAASNRSRANQKFMRLGLAFLQDFAKS